MKILPLLGILEHKLQNAYQDKIMLLHFFPFSCYLKENGCIIKKKKKKENAFSSEIVSFQPYHAFIFISNISQQLVVGRNERNWLFDYLCKNLKRA